MKKLQTKKLFFRKYPYKVELQCEGANYIRLRGIHFVLHATENEHPLNNRPSWSLVHKEIDNIRLHKFATILKPFLDANLKHRSEGSHFNFFVEDKATFDVLVKKFEGFIVSISEPASDEELEFLLSNNRKIVVDELPYAKFKHKIVFKTNWKQEKSKNFLDWMSKYPEEDYKISKSSYEYLSAQSRYCQDPFMYVKEPKMLTMLQLFAGDNIKYVEEFVPRSTLLL